MASSMVVMIVDPDDGKRGEINVVDDARSAAHMVESFLEAGYEQERIRVFNAEQLEMKVIQKPVVSFVSADSGKSAVSDPPVTSEQPASEEAAAVTANGAGS